MPSQPSLRRALGLAEVTFAGVGIILGAGIYALLGDAAGLAGNAVWMAFVISALMAAFTGFSYAELSSMFPSAGAEHEYVSHAMGRRIAFVIGWLSIISAILAATTVSLGFAGYLSVLTGVAVTPAALGLLVLLGLLLFCGIKETSWFNIVATFIETGGVVLLLALGLPHLGEVDYLEAPKGLAGVFQASSLVFFAYVGFEGLVKLAEETRRPEKTIPRGLMLSLGITIVLYVLVSISAVSVVGWRALSASQAPFADVARHALGRDVFIVVSVIALFATTNTALMFLLAASRIIYGMAAAGALPAVLSGVHRRKQTPWAAIALVTAASALFLSVGDIAFIANATNFTVFLIFIAVNATVIILRFKDPARRRPFRIRLSVGRIPLLPIAGILFCVFLSAQIPPGVLLLGLVLTAIGALSSLGMNVRRAGT
ncbi:amino acid permease [Polyangium sp. 15x6]|uniref:APC family permease n=1 Tax=Polyangium sp. 15x6 TaxID=3042687 RepID=UPI00249CBAAD|nr:amino acid permease [Polyangium sp. 15x6]MDI3287428.1 amino acid permease [Polyangium sp. 15x6]